MMDAAQKLTYEVYFVAFRIKVKTRALTDAMLPFSQSYLVQTN